MDNSDDYSFYFMEDDDSNSMEYHFSSATNSDPNTFIAEGTFRYGVQVNRYVGIPHESQMHNETPPIQPNPFQTPMQQPPPMLPAVEDADENKIHRQCHQDIKRKSKKK